MFLEKELHYPNICSSFLPEGMPIEHIGFNCQLKHECALNPTTATGSQTDAAYEVDNAKEEKGGDNSDVTELATFDDSATDEQ